jgi:hypothetical protein
LGVVRLPDDGHHRVSEGKRSARCLADKQKRLPEIL